MVPHVWYLNAHIAAMEYCRTLEDIREKLQQTADICQIFTTKKKKIQTLQQFLIFSILK